MLEKEEQRKSEQEARKRVHHLITSSDNDLFLLTGACDGNIGIG
jgi:3-deoxy-D-arabino-heptulosonate 7-phosphate (DAHP) synthase